MTFKEFKEAYRVRLTPAQEQAVQTVDGPVLLLAVPGSGKTTVLVTRLGYMILGCGISPRSILTMTYTVAATHDMRERFCELFGEEYRDEVEFRTINGVCARIIHSYERMTGGNAFSLITDDKEIAALLTAIYRECVPGEYPTEADIKSVRTQITYAKNQLLGADQIAALDKTLGIPFAEIYKKYCAALREQRRMDYDDQMTYAYRILRQYPEILASVQARYSHICVDEAQDTSKIQHIIISMLAARLQNLFMVGDEDQSIYGFRAAYPEALLTFERDYPGARILKMEDNFRSRPEIVEAADRFVRRNAARHPKTMRATRPRGGEVKEIALASRAAQYSYLLRVAEGGSRDTAVLYRDNESAIPLIDLLERHGVPYYVRAMEPSFFTHRIVRDIAAIIRLAKDPYDTEAFLQVYYKLSTYISKPTALIMVRFCEQGRGSVWEILDQMSDISTGTRKSCAAIRGQLYRLLSDRGDHAIHRIEHQMGYGEYLERINARTNKLAILRAIGRHEMSASALLDRLSTLFELVQNRRSPEECRLILSTVHSAKGLEYDTVYLMDVVDGIFPEHPIVRPELADKDELAAYEEDRRLFYVGATRAKNRLMVFTYADEVSSFADELLQKGRFEKTVPSAPASAVPSRGMSDPRGYEIFRRRFVGGARLYHKVFGEGTVLSNVEDILLVRFDDGSTKRLSLKFLYSESLLEG